MPKLLIVYYSRSGNTRKLALQLNELLHADLIEITDNVYRKGFLGWFRCAREGAKNHLPEIFPKNISVDKYDIVLIGSPVWGGIFASPIKRFLEDYTTQIHKMAFFFSCLGGVGKFGLQEIRKLSSIEPLVQKNREKKQPIQSQLLSEFIQQLV